MRRGDCTEIYTDGWLWKIQRALLTPVHPGHRPWKGLDRPAFVVRFLVPRTMKKYVSESEDPRR